MLAHLKRGCVKETCGKSAEGNLVVEDVEAVAVMVSEATTSVIGGSSRNASKDSPSNYTSLSESSESSDILDRGKK